MRGVILSVVFLLGFVAAPPTSAADDPSPQQLINEQVPAALKILDGWHAVDPVPADRKLHIVYWTPADREPAPAYRERLSRVLLDIQGFYRNEMKRLGFGPRTIRLDLEADGQLRIHVVKGRKPYAEYNVQSGSEIRRECLPTLAAAGIEADKETLVIFCNMSNWDPAAGTISQNSPYYAGGSLRGGTAWQVDSPILDSASLEKREPMVRDGQYGRISLGKYNSIFVGGVCHELGHALGLPHNSERPAERAAFGTALMGSGNRSYGDDRRGEGRGSFLTLGEGLRLASHPMFSGSAKGIDLPANASITEVDIRLAPDQKSFTFAGTVKADPPAYAVVAYMDPAGGSDYDAPSITAVPDAQGRISLRCDALKAGKVGQLRLIVCQANGGRIGDRTLVVPYTVGADGVVDLTAYRAKQQLSALSSAVNAGDVAAADKELKALDQALAASKAAGDALLLDVARSLVGTLNRKPGPMPADATGDTCALSDAAWSAARVGWGRPVANRLPGDTAYIRLAGQIHSRGLYAHAPSAYRYNLGAKWKTLTADAGVVDGNGGSVVFVVLGDGKELYRSKKAGEGVSLAIKVDVSGVNELELRVENAGDGNTGDWGVWVNPTVAR